MSSLSPENFEQLRHAITYEMERLAVAVADKAIRGDQIAEEVSRLEALQKTLSALPAKPKRPLTWALVTGAICLVVASVAGSIPVRTTRIQLDVSSATTTFNLAEDFPWRGGIWRIKPELIRLTDFTRLDLPPEYRSSGKFNLAALILETTNGRAWLSDFDFGRGAQFTISQSGLFTNVTARDARFRGRLNVLGSVSSADGQGQDLPMREFNADLPPGVFEFEFTGSKASAKRAMLRITPMDEAIMRDIRISGLGFFEERMDNLESSHFASQIIFGTITLTDTGEHLWLSPATALELEDAQGVVTALQISPNATRVQFEGSVRNATVGSGKFARKLKPTLLEWLFHQQTIGLLWGALAFLFGTALSARKFLSGQT
jgi:hypothetical protein